MKFTPPEIFYPNIVRKYSSSALLIPYEGKYILLNKSYGKSRLTLPGGLCELNESVAQTALRETQEEIGLDAEIERLINVTYQKTDNNLKGRGDCYHFIFLAKPLNNADFAKIKIDNDEIMDIILLSKEELLSLRDKEATTFLKRVGWALEDVLYSEL